MHLDETEEDFMVRSVAMSANVAETVRHEVNHLIRVNSFVSNLEQSPSTSTTNLHLPTTCTHILPAKESNIIMGIVLSKWDDIMGPQTLHVWLEEFSQKQDQFRKKDKQYICFHEDNSFLMKSIKYVTGHTVNYMGVTTVIPVTQAYPNFSETNASFFVIPDLNIVAHTQVFSLRDRGLSIPYSLSLIIHYKHYEYYLNLHSICHLWLQRLANRMHHLLFIQPTKEFTTSKEMNIGMLEFAKMLISLNTCSIQKMLPLQNECYGEILAYPFIEQAIISHLQTFGCTVVMGSSLNEVNALITFLALFLDKDQLVCSRLIVPQLNYSFHMGLFLQGLLLDGFGCRELSSEELIDHPSPVTAIDIMRGTVKQTASQTLGLSHMFYNMKDTCSKLVQGLLIDLKLLPTNHWKRMTQLFMIKVKALSHALLGLVHEASNKGGSQSLPGRNVEMSKHLGRTLDLKEADLLIVSTIAEKLHPGVLAQIWNSGDQHSAD